MNGAILNFEEGLKVKKIKGKGQMNLIVHSKSYVLLY